MSIGVLGVAYWTSEALLAFLPPDQALALPNLRFVFDGWVARRGMKAPARKNDVAPSQ